jgi:hypothetical protein
LCGGCCPCEDHLAPRWKQRSLLLGAS